MAQHTVRSWTGHMSEPEQVKMGGSTRWWQQYEPVCTDDKTLRIGTKRSKWRGHTRAGTPMLASGGKHDRGTSPLPL